MKLSNRNTNLLSMFDANMCSRQHSRRVDWLPVRAVLNITLCHKPASLLTILPSIRYNMYASSGVSHCVLRPAPCTEHCAYILRTVHAAVYSILAVASNRQYWNGRCDNGAWGLLGQQVGGYYASRVHSVKRKATVWCLSVRLWRRAGFKCVEGLGRIIIKGPYLPTLKCYNLRALTIVIITKYIYIYFYTS